MAEITDNENQRTLTIVVFDRTRVHNACTLPRIKTLKSGSR